MRLSTIVLAVLLGLVLATAALAQGTGRSLDIQPGARQNGMGAAGVALADDATSATWWNPAALGFTKRSAVELTYAQLVPGLATDVNYNFATYVHPLEGWGAFGVALGFLSYGTSEETDNAGTVKGTFDSYEVSSGINYGVTVLPDFAVGASLKYIRIQLAPSSLQGVGSTFGLDLAALYKIPQYRFNLGLNVQNLGPSVTFINEDEASPLSRNVKVGAAWQAVARKEANLVLVYDFNQSLVTDQFRTYNYGLELQLYNQLTGRIGYYKDPLGEIGGYTYGVGITWGGIAFDLGTIPQARDSGLDTVKKLTLGFRF